MLPVRTCVGCRGRSEKSELIRIVAQDDRLVVDSAQRLPGRGAYLHRRESCWASAGKRRVFGRALRAPGVELRLDVDQLRGDPPRLGESGGAS